MNYLVLNQLGTPRSTDPKDVGVYLSEFLMDPNVIPIKRPFRDVLVKCGIVPIRRKASAQKYKKIWTEQGSPLAVNTYSLQTKLQNKLGPEWKVLVGMRYSTPSLQEAFSQIAQTESDTVYFLPLYPHFAQATVHSSLEKMEQVTRNSGQKISVIAPFYKTEWYIETQAAVIQKYLKPEQHLLLSYHGLPISQETYQGISYQTQCLETSVHLKEKLGLAPDQISSGFQSRVGLKKWIEPSTDSVMRSLAEQGVKHLAVACPSFVADCLETLEEIGLELKHEFLSLGGESFQLIPCLNDEDLFVDGIIKELSVCKASLT